MLIAKSMMSFGQFYLIDPYESYTKAQVIANLKKDDGYAKLNADFFFKGTSKRVEYSSNDTLLKSRTLKRVTLFGVDGSMQYDSLVVASNDNLANQFINEVSELTNGRIQLDSLIAAPYNYFVRQLTRKDTMLTLKYVWNGNLKGVDTILLNRNGDLAEYRTESSVKHFTYNDKGWLVLKREITPMDTTEQKISYSPDLITLVDTKKGNYNQDIHKCYYSFNKSSQLVKDSICVIEQQYDLTSPGTLLNTNTSSSFTAYKFDAEGRHISTECDSTKHEILYQNGKVAEEKTFTNGELSSRTVYEDIDDNTVKGSGYTALGTVPFETSFTTRKNGVVVAYTSANKLYEPVQKNVILLDDKGRMLSSCGIALGESADCKVVEYTDY